MVATVQRLARLALTRLDAPCSVTWDELQRSSGVYWLCSGTLVFTTTRTSFGPWHTSSLLSTSRQTTRTRKHDLTAKSRTSFWPGRQPYMYSLVFACLLRFQLTRVQIGNLSFYTTEEQIYELFSKCTSPEEGGGIKRIIMGLDRNTR